jgi:O-acetyl-ADP-ribose deacetylase (regulator of RNase III)
MKVVVGRAHVELVEGDIADQATDAVVTAAHWDLAGGQGTDGAIHFRAGPGLLEECRRIGACPIGGAVLTRGYALAAPYVIHAVGPVWERGAANEGAVLASAYDESLKLAAHHGLRSVSFPSISTGAFSYPMRLAAPVAMRTIVAFLRGESSLELVRMVLYPRETRGAFAIYAAALRDVTGFGFEP